MAMFLKRLHSLKHSRLLLAGLVLALSLGLGGAAYLFQGRRAAATATEEPVLKTATVRRGDLVVSASGSAVLAPAEKFELGFESGSLVTGVFVAPGDQVKAGDLLAQVDDREARNNYEQAKREYEALTSTAAIASALEQVAQAQTDLDSARYDLEYLISPQVFYWEMQVEEAKQARKQAKAALEANPTSQEAQSALEKAKAYLDFAEDKLAEAWNLYYEEYVPATFHIVKEIGEKDIYDAPTDLQITLARTAIAEAEKRLTESKIFYEALTSGVIPDNATSDALLRLRQAKSALEEAQATLDGTKIYAPISGTILSVNISIGNTIGKGDVSTTETDADSGEETITETAMETAIVMADLSNLSVDVYLDESDWELVAVGEHAEIAFDALPDRIITGTVVHVDDELYQSNDVSVIHARVQIDSGVGELDLPIGASGTVEVIHAQVEDAVLIPVEALREVSPGHYAVFVVEGERLRLRSIEVGLQGQLYVEVKSGLQTGEIVSTGLATTN